MENLENQEIKIITSECGKDLALTGSNKYRFIRQRKDGLIKWLCTQSTCYASILTNSGCSKIKSMLGEHNHILITKEKIEHLILRENCKCKADDSISIRPSKIILYIIMCLFMFYNKMLLKRLSQCNVSIFDM
jgi:hypothetical protein